MCEIINKWNEEEEENENRKIIEETSKLINSINV